MDQSEIEQVFEAFDTDNKGYLTLNQFEKLGEDMDLPPPELQKIFNTMDTNSDGLVEQSEFVNSFNSLTALILDDSHQETPPPPQIVLTDDTNQDMNLNNNNNTDKEKQVDDTQRLEAPGRPRRRSSTPRRTTGGLRSQSWHESRRKVRKSSPSILDSFDNGDSVYTANPGSWDTFADSLGEAVYAISSYDGISQVYRSVEATGNGELLRSYESMVQGVVKEITRVQKEMSEMETSFEKAKEMSNLQQAALEEEMESQILKEKELRIQDRKKADDESEKVRSQYEIQIDQLQGAIKKLKQFDQKLSSISPYEKELESMREKVRKLNQENLALRNKLTEAETNAVLLQNSIKEMELENQEKALQYISFRDEEEADRANEERDRISSEVESLYSSHRQLIDSNDNLREALEKSMKRASARFQPNGAIPPELMNGSGRSSRASMLEMDALAECDPGRNGFLPHDFDSGVGTIRDELDDSGTDWGDESYRRRRNHPSRLQRNPSNGSWASGGSRRTRSRRSHRRADYQHSEDDDTNDVTNVSDITDDELRDISQSSTLSSGSRGRLSIRSGRLTPGSSRKVITPDITLGHNARMYRVILCGDSGVGKTSFINRVCRNEFQRMTKSTLGIDFQIKTIQLEHTKSVSIQLWDTAGQERFRSISASYFRRAEGVLLLYDCTNQDSFINVRDWMETITPAIAEGTPIMICGHKVDLRPEREVAGRAVVSAQDGAQLAANYEVLFVETSALDGCNVNNAVAMLARHIKLDDENDDAASVKQLGLTSEREKACCKQS